MQKKVLRRIVFLVFSSLLFGVTPISLYATEYSSVSFQLRDPVLFPASYSTSSGYSASITVGQPSIGTSTVATAGTVGDLRSGFLYFPLVTTPTVTATPGSGQVSLSWNAATGFLGWVVSGYSVGRSTVSGGPYSYSSVGAVTSSTATGLSNGTAYYFVVVAKDFFGASLSTSTQVTATPVAAAVTTPPSTSGGIILGRPGGATTPLVIPPLTELPVDVCRTIADLNCDGYVDVIDFSIMYYWFEKNDPPERVDLQPNDSIDIGDFSVMAHYWHERN